MSHRSADLVGYYLDLIEPEERVAIERQLASDPELARALRQIAEQLAPLARTEQVEIPRGLADRTIEAAADPALSAARGNEWAASTLTLRGLDVAVAAGILLVCATLVFPAIASLRGDKGRAVCADNLRQIGIALDTYQFIEAGRLPAIDPSGPLNNAGVFTLLLQARDLLPQTRILVCPMADNAVVYVPDLAEYLATPANSIVRELQKRQMSGSYGYSLGHRKPNGDYVPPADAHAAAPVVADRPARVDEPNYVGENSPNHGGFGQNVLFADGHVRWLGSPRVGRDDIYHNRSGRLGAGEGMDDFCIGPSEAVPFRHGSF